MDIQLHGRSISLTSMPSILLALLLVALPVRSRAKDVFVPVSPARAGADGSLNAEQARYRCRIAGALEYLRNQPIVAKNPLIVIDVLHRRDAYQQCMMEPDRQTLYCEAASGFYYEPARKQFNARKLNTMEGLGYTPDGSNSNFTVEIPVSGPRDMYGAAGMLIETFVRIYDLKPAEVLEYWSKNLSGELPASVPGVSECP